MPKAETQTASQTSDPLGRLVQAMQSGQLLNVSQEILQSQDGAVSATALALAQQGRDACLQITDETKQVQQRLIARLSAAGLDAEAPFELTQNSGLQYHEFSLNISADQLGRVLDIVSDEGFAVDDVLKRKWKSVGRASSGLYLMAWDTVSTRMFLRWKPAKGGLLEKLRPVPADYAFAPIPNALWPGYFLVKPARVLIEKLTGRRTADRLGLKSGSFSLGTPHVLLEPLFTHVGLTKEDTIVDLGCGDGRILIAAAKLFGCKAKGVEQNAALVSEANEAARAEGVADLVEIEQGSALDYPLSSASIVFMFLPKALLPIILAKAQTSAKAGTRLLAHEQHRLDTGWAPDSRMPIIADNAMTVAHIWTVQEK